MNMMRFNELESLRASELKKGRDVGTGKMSIGIDVDRSVNIHNSYIELPKKEDVLMDRSQDIH